MPSSTNVLHTTAWEDAGLVLMARVTGNDGANITQASLSSVTLYVYDLSDVANPTVDGVAQTVSSVIFDTLQTSADDSRWTLDSVGYNVRISVPASAFPDSSRYRIEVVFAPASGDNFPLVAIATVQNLLSS